MSEWDNRSEPHVSTEELRAALAPRGESRRNPVLVSEHSEQADDELADLRAALDAARVGESELRDALEHSRRAVDGARADAIELRAALDAARGDAAELRAELASTKVDLRERRVALEKLASAGAFRRRRVLAELRSRSLI
jgi:septal ring factor EnvC (AmiA/AmiB activator)